jgi:hypothetical protein
LALKREGKGSPCEFDIDMQIALQCLRRLSKVSFLLTVLYCKGGGVFFPETQQQIQWPAVGTPSQVQRQPDFHLHTSGSSPLRSRVVISKPNPTLILAKPMLPQFLHLIQIGILKYITRQCPMSFSFGEFLSKGNIVLWK